MPTLLRARSRAWVAAACCAVIVSLAAVPAANAGTDTYCGAPPNPRNYGPYDSCVGPRHSMRSNLVQNYYGSPNRVCAGARHGETYDFYGSFLCGSGQRCHPYSGDRLLYPVAHNGENFSQHLFGIDYYGSDSYSPCG
jgi:hypothetical protein